MTRNELKGLIKNVVLNEMRIRKSDRYVAPERVRIAQAVQSVKDKEQQKAQRVAKDAEMLAKLDQQPKDVEYFDRQYVNVKARIDKLSAKIEELENQMAIAANIPDRMEALNRQIDLVKIKIPLEIKRLEEFQNLEEIKVELEKILKQSKI